jgi:hypothetical protein
MESLDGDLELARAAAARDARAMERFAERLRCARAIVVALNARLPAPSRRRT